MKHHPDRVASGEKDAAEAKFKEITEAYEVLRDPERRATYDRYGEAGLKRGAGAGAGGFAPPNPPKSRMKMLSASDRSNGANPPAPAPFDLSEAQHLHARLRRVGRVRRLLRRLRAG